MENSRLTVSEFKKRLIEESERKGILLSANIEITSECNFRCNHCYNENVERGYMSLNSFGCIIKELRSLGCVYLTITGGEPLLHPQFREIYKKAYEAGFIITLFTNGYVIDDFIDILSVYKPYEVDISLYGIDNESYFNNTGIINGKRVIDNLSLLNKMGITFSIKTVVTQNIFPCLEQMKMFADKFKVTFRFDMYIFLSEKQECNVERLAPKEIAGVLLKNSKYVELEKEALKNKDECRGELLYNCKPGENNIFITWNEYVKMCPFTSMEHSYSLQNKGGTIQKARNYLQAYGKLQWAKDSSCYQCKYSSTCKKCPERFYIETGSYFNGPSWMCDAARHIYNAIQEN